MNEFAVREQHFSMNEESCAPAAGAKFAAFALRRLNTLVSL
jgi:hypothetical protein